MSSSYLLPRIDRDSRLIIGAAALRALDYGFLSAFIGVYLAFLDFSPLQASLVFSGIMAGGAVSNVVALKGDAIGRRRMLVTMSALMVLGGVLMPSTTSMVVLAVIGPFAMTTATGGDRTAFISLDTAILAQTVDARARTTVFSWYNLAGVIAKAVSAPMIAIPALLQSQFNIGELASFKVMFGVYAAMAASGIVMYGALSPRVERQTTERGEEERVPFAGKKETRGVMYKMSALFALDATGGGFMTRAFLSYWFVRGFGVDLYTISGIFFGIQVMNAVSVWASSPISHRIGLINTMAFSQALSNILMVGVALSTNLWMAITMLMVKELSNDMDIPTRQSYTMAIVPRDARTQMATVNNLGRNITQIISPTLAGAAAQLTFLGAPFVIGSGIKLTYNALLYGMFKGVKAPEEHERRAGDAGKEPVGSD